MVQIEKLKIRLAEKKDARYLSKWLDDPDIIRWFPMCNHVEIEDSVRLWMDYSRYRSVITAVYDNVPCGNALLYINTLKKLSHQCLLAIIVDKDYRNKKIGTTLINELFKIAKERFRLEFLHLEVYVGNPAYSLYERLGFKQYGVHRKFLKDLDGKYYDKILMQKKL